MLVVSRQINLKYLLLSETQIIFLFYFLIVLINDNMTKKKKIYDREKNNPKDVRFDDIWKMLE